MSLYDAAGERGHDTSTAMREREAVSGRASERQAGALAEVRSAGARGITWAEVARNRGWHHGQATGALSALHRRGLIARLEETRDGCGLYVVPEAVGGRPTVKQGRRYDAQTLARDVPLDVLREALRIAETPPPNERTTAEGFDRETGARDPLGVVYITSPKCLCPTSTPDALFDVEPVGINPDCPIHGDRAR